MSEIADADKTVGKIAGTIYTEITSQFPYPPIILIPALTFKVKKIMEQITDLKLLSKEQKIELAKDIQVAIAPLLFTYEIDAAVIEQIMPLIESAALKALTQAA